MGRLSRENSTVIFSSVSYLLVIFIGRILVLVKIGLAQFFKLFLNTV